MCRLEEDFLFERLADDCGSKVFRAWLGHGGTPVSGRHCAESAGARRLRDVRKRTDRACGSPQTAGTMKPHTSPSLAGIGRALKAQSPDAIWAQIIGALLALAILGILWAVIANSVHRADSARMAEWSAWRERMDCEQLPLATARMDRLRAMTGSPPLAPPHRSNR